MKFMYRTGLAALACIAIGAQSGPASAANQKVAFSMPNLGITFAYAYIADKMGFWKDQGLDVDLSIIDGAGGAKALLSGDIQFTGSSGIQNLLAPAAGQPTIAIANVHDQINIELLLTDVALKKVGLDPKTATQQQRAKALKGLIIACAGGPNTIPDGLLRYILSALGGLDPDKDVTITYMQPEAVAAAARTNKVDAMITSPPFTTIAEQGGYATDWIGGTRGDLSELNPFVYTTISATKPYCEKNSDLCTKFLTGVNQAIKLMKTDPEKGLQLITPVYKGMEPNVLKIGYLQQIDTLNPTERMTDKMFETTQNFALGAGLLKAAQKRTGFDGVNYTNAYLK